MLRTARVPPHRILATGHLEPLPIQLLLKPRKPPTARFDVGRKCAGRFFHFDSAPFAGPQRLQQQQKQQQQIETNDLTLEGGGDKSWGERFIPSTIVGLSKHRSAPLKFP